MGLKLQKFDFDFEFIFNQTLSCTTVLHNQMSHTEDNLNVTNFIYEDMKRKTEFIRESSNNPNYRNIIIVMQSLKNLIPADIFTEYQREYQDLAEDTYYCAPEVMGNCWLKLAHFLEMVVRQHPEANLGDPLKKCFSGTP